VIYDELVKELGIDPVRNPTPSFISSIPPLSKEQQQAVDKLDSKVLSEVAEKENM
jgi:hypothetical protein